MLLSSHVLFNCVTERLVWKRPPSGLRGGCCCCLIPLKEINERSTNRKGGDRRMDEREAVREGGGRCVLVRGVFCELHSCPAESMEFFLSLSLLFLFSFTFSHSTGSLSLMVSIPLSLCIPPVLPVTGLCLWCHSGQRSQACLECETDRGRTGEMVRGGESDVDQMGKSQKEEDLEIK